MHILLQFLPGSIHSQQSALSAIGDIKDSKAGNELPYLNTVFSLASSIHQQGKGAMQQNTKESRIIYCTSIQWSP